MRIFRYVLCLGFIFGISSQVLGQGSDIPKPNRAQRAWQEAELGVIFHYDLHVFDNKKYSQGANRVTPIEDHNIFNPQELDTDQWIQSAKEMGAKFALLTVTHETGFALFPSAVNPYNVKILKWRDGKGDIVRDFVESCRRFNIKPGLYIGIRWNSFLGVHNFRVIGDDEFAQNRQRYYNHMVEQMVTELCTNYSELFEIWFDGGAYDPAKGAPDVLPIVKKHQPNALFYHNSQLAEARWGGSESGTVAYPCWVTFAYPSTDSELYPINTNLLKTGDPNGKFWMPAMSDAPLRGYQGRHEWFWEPGDEEHIYPLDDLMNMYYKSVGRNSTLILGITPDPKGLVPDAVRKRMQEFGEEIKRRFSQPIAMENGEGNQIELSLNKPTQINHIIIQEEIFEGERVREFLVEGYRRGQWITLSQGTCIGHKRIENFNTVEVSKIRLIVVHATGKPIIKNLSLFHVPKTLIK